MREAQFVEYVWISSRKLCNQNFRVVNTRPNLVHNFTGTKDICIYSYRAYPSFNYRWLVDLLVVGANAVLLFRYSCGFQMPEGRITFELQYTGARTDIHEIDFYDVSQALVGFQRSLALTTHLILNGEIITQSPSLRGARLFAVPAEEGSWKWKANVVFVGTALYALTTAPHDTVLGNLVTSAYDYVISERLGFHVDYERPWDSNTKI